LADFEVAAKLPSRTAPGRWNESYFPIKDEAGQVQHVGVIVLELTRRKYLEASVLRLSDKLTLLGSALRRPADELEPAIAPGAGESRGDLFVRALGLLESCLSDARDISQLLSVGPPITVVDTFQLSELSSAPVPPSEQRQEPLYSQRVEGPGSLSAREREITAYLASGKTNKQIAAMLAISTRTVESHRARVMLKLDLHSLSDLVRYALRRKLIPS
jgi:DNA-binding CsgD family transcriptional regulator